MSHSVFTADYDKRDVTRRVWAPLGIAVAMGVGGLLVGAPALSLLAAFPLVLALRFWPLTRENRPALCLSPEGAEIDGLGLVKWGDIASVDKGVVKVKALKVPALDLEFRRPIQEVFHATEATRLRPWEIRIFKLRRDGKLRLDLGKLEDTPDEVHDAFRHFISGGVA